jgi:hypothetical protein
MVRMASRLDLVSSRASVSRFDVFLNDTALQDERLLATMESENLGRRQAVHAWLKPTDMEKEQDYLERIRADYPNTCHWLLDDRTFKDWFDPEYTTTTLPKLLWLNGKPGAGKFTHASTSQALENKDSQSGYRKDCPCISSCGRSEKAQTSLHGLVFLLQA